MHKISEAITAALSTLRTWGFSALADDRIQGAEWFGLTGVGVAFFSVWAIKHRLSVRADVP